LYGTVRQQHQKVNKKTRLAATSRRASLYDNSNKKIIIIIIIATLYTIISLITRNLYGLGNTHISFRIFPSMRNCPTTSHEKATNDLVANVYQSEGTVLLSD
jgi:hypothetical protein